MRSRSVKLALVVVFGLMLCAVASAQPTPSYHSPMRDQCEEELSKDKDWFSNLERRLYAKIQRDASRYATTNNRHVVMAYGALWIVTVGFVALVWLRQKKLKDEIAKLEEQLKKAESSS